MKEALEQELVNFAKEIIAHQGQLNISKMRQQALRLTDKITILGFVEKYYQTLKASEERMLYTMRKVASFIEEHQEEDIFNIDTDVTEIEPLNIQFQKEEAAPLAFVAMEPAPITKQSAPAPAAAQPTPPPAFTAPAAPPQPQQHTEPASAPAPTPAAAQPTPPPAFTAPAAQPQPQQHTEPTPAPAFTAPAAAQPTPPPAFTAPAAQPQPQQHTEPASAPAPAPAAAQQPQQHTEPASAPAPAPAAAQPTPPPAFTAPAVPQQPQQHTEPAPYKEPLYSIHAKQDPRDETEEEQEARIEKVLQHVFEATQAFIPEAMKYKPFPQEEEEEGVAHEPKDFPTEPEAQPFFAAAAKPATPASTPTAPPPASVAKEPEKPHNHNPFEAMAEQFIQQHVQEQAAQQKQQQAAQQVQQMQQQTAQQHLHEQMQHNPFGINNATPNTPFGQPTAAPAAQPQPLENPFAATANQDNVKTSWAMNIDQPSSQNIAQPSSQNIAQPQPAARQTPSLEEFLSQKAKTASFERKNPEEPKPTQSLNDRFSKAIQIGLNDKLAFVQKLFFGSESEYNKVLKHLEELHSLEEAAVYIQQQVKPTYNHWKGKEEYEERFLSLILRRFE